MAAPWEQYAQPATDGPWAAYSLVNRETSKEKPLESSNTAVLANALWKGAAAVPDMVLNTPQNVVNLGRAAYGSAATAFGRPDLAPEINPTADIVRKGAESVGLINPKIVPQGGFQQGIDLLGQGAVGGALTGGGGLARTMAGVLMGATSAGAAGATQEATGSPELAVMAGMLPGARAAFSNPSKSAALKSQNSFKDETWALAQKEGYVTPPSAINPTWVGNRIEGIGGKAAIGQDAALRNQPVTNKIARREAGLAENEPITEGTLSAARATMAAPYREVASLNPLAASALEKLQQTRVDAKVFWNHYNRSGDPASLKEAQRLDKNAQMYETAIDKIASRQGSPDLLNQLRDARVRLAKNHEVDRALNVGTGDVDAKVLGRMLDKGKPLTDGLATIGRFANAFPSVSRDAANVPPPGISKLEGLTSLGLGGAGLYAGVGFAPAAIPLVAPHVARSLALSRLMQGQRQYGPGVGADVGNRTSPIATNAALNELLRRNEQEALNGR